MAGAHALHTTDPVATTDTHRHEREDRLYTARSFEMKPSKYPSPVNTEERSLIITFILFALILATAAALTMGLLVEDGSGSITSATTAVGNAISFS